MGEVLGAIVSVNVGRPRAVPWEGRTVETAIWKEPAPGRVAVGTTALQGDAQADLKVHGGRDQAVYAYSAEDYGWWSRRLGRDLAPGTFGENLTVSGLRLDQALVGETWRAGTATLQVTQPRMPCTKLGIRMGDLRFVEAFQQAARFGAYLRVVKEGTVAAGDEVKVLERPQHGLTITDLGMAGPDPPPRLLELVLSVPEVPEGWRKWAERAVRRAERGQVG